MSREPPNRVIANAVRSSSDETFAKIGNIDAIKRNIRNIRNRESDLPKIPKSIDSFEIEGKFAKTNRNEDFLLYDSGPSFNRIIIFATQNMFNLLCESKKWFGDGCFKVKKSLFKQLYTIHILSKNISIPLLYCLLPNKEQDTYIRLFTLLKDLGATEGPDLYVCDYEISVHNALKEVYDGISIQGCYFHYKQAIRKNLKKHNLYNLFKSDVNFCSKIKRLISLCFVPEDYIEDYYTKLMKTGDYDDIEEFVKYFEGNFIGKLAVSGIRKNARFHPSCWSFFKCSLQNTPRTNNHVEGWNRALQSLIDPSNASVWQIIDAIKSDQSNQSMKYVHISMGKYRGKIRKVENKDLACIEDVISYWSVELDPIDYLSNISFASSL